MPRFPLVFLPFLLVATLLAAGALWRLGDLRAQRGTQTISLEKVVLGGPFTLTDQNGAKRSDADFRGKYMLVFFGYTLLPGCLPDDARGDGCGARQDGCECRPHRAGLHLD